MFQRTFSADEPKSDCQSALPKMVLHHVFVMVIGPSNTLEARLEEDLVFAAGALTLLRRPAAIQDIDFRIGASAISLAPSDR